MKKCTQIPMLVFFVSAFSANAATIYMDFSNNATATTDIEGNRWNSFGANNSNPNNLALVDTTNASTGITLTVTSGNGSGSGWGGFSGTNGPAPFDEPFIASDGLFVNSSNIVPIIFSGLAANTEYSFGAVSRRNTGTLVNGRFTISAGTSTDIGGGLTLTVNDSNILSFDATSDGSGVITLGFGRIGSTSGAILSGMSLTAIPEPGAFALLGMAGMSLLLRRRRHA